ncbi:10697_t:CDS:2, partial [Gigaspora rosea]
WSLGAYLLKKVPEKDDPSIPQHLPSQIQISNDQMTESTPLLKVNSHVKTFFNFKFMNPPLYAALLALIFITIPNSNYLFAAIDYIGSITVPLTLLTLGAQLYNLPRSLNENISSIIIYILTCRFLLMPIIGILLVFHTTSYYTNDPMLWFIIILISFGPPAITCINLAQLANNYQEEFAALLFYGYIFATPLAAILVIFLLNNIKEFV